MNSYKGDNSTSEYLSLADAAREFGLSQDYLRFLIFKKKLKAEKIGRNWVTTKGWILEQRQGISAPTNGSRSPVVGKHLSNPQLATSTPPSPLNLDRLDSWAKRTLRRDPPEKRGNGIVDNRLLENFFRLCKNKTVCFALSLVVLSAGLTFVDASPNTLYAVAEKAAARLAVLPHIVEVAGDFLVGLEPPTFSEVAELAGDVFNRAKTISFSDVKRLAAVGIASLEHVAEAGTASLEHIAEAGTASLEHVAEAGIASLEHIAEAGTASLEHVAEAGTASLEHVAEAGTASLEHIAEAGAGTISETPAAIGNFILEYRPPTPRQFAENIRKDLRDIFQKAKAPSPKAAVTALRDIFEKAAEGLFGLVQPETELGTRNLELGGEKTEPGAKPEELSIVSQPVPSSSDLVPSSSEPAPIREITKEVTQVTERREIITPADLSSVALAKEEISSFQRKLDDINSYVLTQFSKVFGDLTLLSSRIDTKTPFTVFAQSQKIDSLINPLIKEGLIIDSGTLQSRSSFDFDGDGRIKGKLTVDQTAIISGNVTIGGSITNTTTGTSTFNYGLIVADKGGLVGIGTSSPFAKLSVAGLGTGNNTYAFAVSDSASTTRMVITDSGRVGINTSTPSALFDVYNAIRIGNNESAVLRASTGKGLELEFDISNVSVIRSFDRNAGNHKELIINASATRFQQGPVGVGSSSPGAILSISAATTVPAFLLDQTSTGDLLTLQDSGATVFTVKDGGNVGIATTVPGALLSINGSILAQTGTSTFGGLISPALFSTTSLAFYTSSNAAPRIFIDTSGNVGVGTTGPGAALAVAGQCVTGDTRLRRRRRRKRGSAFGVGSSESIEYNANDGRTRDIQLRKAACLAESRGISRRNLWADQEFSAGGALRTYFANTTSRVLNSLEHLGRPGKKIQEGIYAILVDSPWFSVRTQYGLAYCNTAAVSGSGAVSENSQGPQRSHKNVERPHQLTKVSSNSELRTPNFELITEEYVYDEVMIKDIQAGDEILSLNEKTGRLEYQPVLALYDMGVKPIYELKTESGKTIRTTGNHPYLTRKNPNTKGKSLFERGLVNTLENPFHSESPVEGAEWIKVYGLAVGDEILTLPGNQNNQSQGDYGQRSENIKIGHNIIDIIHGFYSLITATLKSQEINDRAAPSITTGHWIDPLTNGPMNMAPKNTWPAAINTLETALNWESLNTFQSYQGGEEGVKRDSDFSENQKTAFEAVLGGLKLVRDSGLPTNVSIASSKSLSSGNVDNLGTLEVAGIEPASPWMAIPVSSQSTPRAQQLYQARDDESILWDHVISIKRVGWEQVYDITVKNTHNFVAGHYINQKTGKALTPEQEEAYYQRKFGVRSSEFGERGSGHSQFPTPNFQLDADIVFGGIVAHNTLLQGTTTINGAGLVADSVFSTTSLAFYTSSNAAPRLLIDTNGRVGIGTTGPSALLSLNGPFLAQGTSTILGGGLNLEALQATGTLAFYTSGTDAPRMIIDESGNVGVGTQTFPPTGRLTIYDNAATPILVVNNLSGTGNGNIVSLQNNGVTKTFFDRDGSLGIFSAGATKAILASSHFTISSGTSSPLAVLNQGSGSVGDIFQSQSGGATNFVIKFWGGIGVGTSSPGGFLSVSAGTTAPAFLLNQTSTGDLLTLQDNGSTVFTVKDGGNVGIATSVPGALLSISGPFLVQGTSTINSAGLITDGLFSTSSLNFYTASNITPRLRILDGGSVGIGTTSPGALLSVNNGSAVIGGVLTAENSIKTSFFVATSTSVNSGIGTTTPGSLFSVNGSILAQTGTSTFGGIISPSVFSTTSLAFYTSSNAAARLLIDTSGRVGIGTTGPSALLSINGPFLAQGTSTILGGGLNLEALQATGTLGFYTAGTAAPRAVINSSGNVGIGTTGPSSLLSVSGSSGFMLTNTGTGPAFYVEDAANDTTPFVIDAAGVVGIGTTTPSAKLSITGTGTGTGRIFALANSSNAEQLTIFDNGTVGLGTTSPAEKLTLRGGSFLQTGGDGVTSYTPTTLGGIDTTGVGQTFRNPVFVSGKYAYITTGAAVTGVCSSSDPSGCEFRIYDVSTSTPSFVGGADIGAASPIFVSGSIAYVGLNAASTTSGELLIYDISNSSNPKLLASVEGSVQVNNIYVAGRYAYVVFASATGNDFRIIDISDSTSPVTLGGVELATPQGVYVSGRYAYVVKNSNTGVCQTPTTLTGCDFQIIDISNPVSPAVVGGVDFGTDGQSIYVSGHYAYVGKSNAGITEDFMVYDVSDPANPATTTAVDLSVSVNAVQVFGKYAYVGVSAVAGDEFRIIDVSNPYSITTIGGVALSNAVNGLFVQGKRAYVGTANVAGNDFFVMDLLGVETQAMLAHSLEAGQAQVRDSLIVGQGLYSSSLNTGLGGIQSTGPLSVFIASTTQVSPVSASFMGGSVGVGTSSPPARLSVTGRGTVTDWAFLVTDSASTTRFLIRDNGTVGIGTDTPGALLSVNNGSAVIGGVLTAENNIKTSFFVATSTSVNSGIGTTTPGSLFSVNGSILAQTGTSTFGGLISPSVFSTTSLAFHTNSNAAPRILIDTSGRVGIGTTGPSALLSLNGPFLAQGTSTILGGGLNLEALQATGTLGFYTAGTAAPRAVIDSSGNFGIGTTGPAAFFSAAGAGYFTGNVGIGLASPNAQLHLNTTAGTDAFRIGSTTNQFIVDSLGRVGIGTTSPTERVALRGGSLFQAGGDGVTSYTPNTLGGVDIGAGVLSRVSGRYAYLVNDLVGGLCTSSDSTGCDFRIYDISTTSPSFVGGMELGPNRPNNIFVSGNYAFIVKNNNSNTVPEDFVIYDISNPSAIATTSAMSLMSGVDGGNAVTEIYVSGRYAYVAGNFVGNDFQIIDISSPSTPVVLGGVDVGGAIHDVFIQGRYAYLIRGHAGGVCSSPTFAGCEFLIADISNPVSPVLVGGVDLGGSPSTGEGGVSVEVSGPYAYVGKAPSGIVEDFIIYDISNPAAISTTTGIDLGITSGGIYVSEVSGRYAYIGNAVNTTGNDFRILDVGDPYNIVIVGGVDFSIGVNAVSTNGRRAYVSLASVTGNDFRVLDLTGIEAQSVLAHSLEAGNAQIRNDLIVSGGLFSSSLNVGLGGIQSTGPLSVFVASTTQVSPVSASFMGGSVGVGTSSPPARLSVTGRGTVTDWAFLVTDSASTTRFMVRDNGTIGVGTTTPYAQLAIELDSTLLTGTNTPVFAIGDEGTSTPIFVVSGGGGFVGVGTSSPGTRFAVTGNINLNLVDGNNAAMCHTNGLTQLTGVTIGDCSAAPAQDYAEMYPTEQGIEFGDIVVTGERTAEVKDTDGQGNIVATSTWATSVLKKSGQPYQSAVVGVISNNYGDFTSTGHNVINNEDNPMPVALSGRVPVKVSLEGGEIKPGDSITTSSIPGVGMRACGTSESSVASGEGGKAYDCRDGGETIGIALASFDGWKTNTDGSQERVEVGKVMVFVKLGYSRLDGAVSSEFGVELPTPNSQPTINAFSVDQQSGKVSVNFFGDLRLNGNSIVDVKSITGMWGKWSIDENGKVIAKEVETEVLTVKENATFGSIEKRIGITIYDEDTGEPYCLKMKGGIMKSEAGVCQSATNLQPTTDNQQPTTESEPQTESETSSLEFGGDSITTEATSSPELISIPVGTTTETSSADSTQPSSETPASAETATAGETAGMASSPQASSTLPTEGIATSTETGGSTPLTAGDSASFTTSGSVEPAVGSSTPTTTTEIASPEPRAS